MHIDDVRRLAVERSGDWIAAFEAAVDCYFASQGDDAALPLIGLMSDDISDDLNFYLIHTVERADMHVLTRALAQHTAEHAPEPGYWVETLHLRVFNSADYVAAYSAAVAGLAPAEKRKVAGYLDLWIANPKNARFASVIDGVRTAAT